MSISDWAMIGAVVAGPILAVQAQKLIESWRERSQRRLWVFKTLMATRGLALSPAHVQALNNIDLEFSDSKPKEKAVIEAWHLYLDHLNDAPRDPEDTAFSSNLDTWFGKSQELLVDLLYAMGSALNHHFDKVRLKKGAYTPKGYVDIEAEQGAFRRGMVELLSGKRRLPVDFKMTPPRAQTEEENEASQLRHGMLELLSGRRSLRVDIASANQPQAVEEPPVTLPANVDEASA